MAKKKSKSVNTAPKNIKKEILKKSTEETMISKVEVKKPQDSEKVSKIVGSIFIVLGILLVGFGVYSFVRYNSVPKLDTALVPPTFGEIPAVVNTDNVAVVGNAKGYDTVYVYLNDEKVGTIKVAKDGAFNYELALVNEGEYRIAIAGIKGFPSRHLSSQSPVQVVTLDKTAPVLAAIKFPTEVGTKTFTVTGTVEANAQVIVKRGTDYYSATCDDKGNFKIVSIALDKGDNVFNVVIKDTAGNETTLTGKIKITYSPDSNVDGDAVKDNTIPVADGNMDNVADFLAGNKLVWIFTLIAVLGGLTTTSVLYIRNKRE